MYQGDGVKFHFSMKHLTVATCKTDLFDCDAHMNRMLLLSFCSTYYPLNLSSLLFLLTLIILAKKAQCFQNNSFKSN